MTGIEAGEVQIWIARPGDFQGWQWTALAALLDQKERERRERFKFDADREAYVLAHAMRRIALGRALQVAAADIVLSADANGKPMLAQPAPVEIFFSDSRSRDAVACAVTRIGPVGIDVEAMGGAEFDFDLLSPFLVVPDEKQRAAQLGSDPAQQFFFYWTALEAFWKALGTGLAPTNPRIHLRKNGFHTFDATFEGHKTQTHGVRVIPIRGMDAFAVTLALAGPDDCMRLVHNNSAAVAIALQSYTNT
jgi:4'-phosphopantetheinyl transferase